MDSARFRRLLQNTAALLRAFFVTAAVMMLLVDPAKGVLPPSAEIDPSIRAASPFEPSNFAVNPGAPAPEASAAWRRVEQATGTRWQVTWNLRTGLPRQAIPAELDVAGRFGIVPRGSQDRTTRSAALDAALVESMSRSLLDELGACVPGLPAMNELVPLVVERRGGVWWVVFGQVRDGVRIEGARADFRYAEDGRLLRLALDLVPSGVAGIAPLVSIDEAPALALDALIDAGLERESLQPSPMIGPMQAGRSERTARVAAGPELGPHAAWLPIVNAADRLELHLVYFVRTEQRDADGHVVARYLSAVDAASGAIVERENEFRHADISGHAEADVQLVLPTDPFVTRPLPDLRVTVAGIGAVTTDASGDWSVPSPDPFAHQVSSVLTGSFAHINDVTGPEPLFSALANPGVPITVHFGDSNSEAAERDAFYYVNIVHDWVKGIDPSFTGLDYEMNVNVNINANCNAFWDGSSINFYKAGGGCANTAQVGDVVYHEYGHGDVQFSYAPVLATASEHEGFADYHTCSLTDQPLMGRGMNGPGTFIRNLDNNRQDPAPECNGEPHCVGEVIGGALWHMRENLITRLGSTAGVTLADHLFHTAFYGRDVTFEGYMWDLLAVDDDNGTLLDGTPHALEILTAFDGHNIGPGYVLRILHDPITDTDDDTSPHHALAVFDCPADLIGDSLAVYYSTGPVGGAPTIGPTRVAMTPTGGVREFEAFLPAQPLGTEVRYFVSGFADTLGITETSPDGAPAVQHIFRVEIDQTAPSISHEVIFDRAAASWPIAMRATVTDNQGLSTVEVEWKRNGADQLPFALSREGVTDAWSGVFNGTVLVGEVVSYRIKATDGAQIPNVAFDPPAGYHTFNVTQVWRHDAEHGVQDITHEVVTPSFADQWHASTQRNFTPGGAVSWKFGDTGNGPYTDTGDGALLTPSIQLGVGGVLSFRFWIQAEEDTGQRAWDGAIIEITTNAGVSWTQLTPQGGYTHTIIPNESSPFPPNTPCWSGSQGWIQVMVDLSAFSQHAARIRWRFGSDAFIGLIGWYVDDLAVDPGGTSTGLEDALLPAVSGFSATTPNPFVNSTNLSFAVAAPSRVRIEVFDVSGRRVRLLAEEKLVSGYYTRTWDGLADGGANAGAGVYFVRLSVGQERFKEKLLKLR